MFGGLRAHTSAGLRRQASCVRWWSCWARAGWGSPPREAVGRRIEHRRIVGVARPIHRLGAPSLDTGQADSGLWVAQLLRRRRVARSPARLIHLKVALPTIGDHEGDRTTYPRRDGEGDLEDVEEWAVSVTAWGWQRTRRGDLEDQPCQEECQSGCNRRAEQHRDDDSGKQMRREPLRLHARHAPKA